VNIGGKMMIKGKNIKLLSTMLVLVLVLGAFLAGCGDKGKDIVDSKGDDKKQDDAKAKEDDKKDDKKEDETGETTGDFDGYPMDVGDVTISWWVGAGYGLHEAYATADESPFHAGLIEHTGVNIDWQFPTAGTDASQSRNLLIASGELPDIMYTMAGQDMEHYMEEGVVRDLTDYIQEYSPAYYKLLQSNEAYDKGLKTDSGKYYGYGFFREDGGWNDTYLGPVVRQDWLDELNLKTPETISDWDETLKAFKAEYDAVLSFGWNRFRTTGISGAFGAYGAANYQLFVDDNNKIQLAQAQPEWKEYMAKLNEWWSAGLLDQDVMTMDDDIARTKALNEVMGLSVTSMGQLTNWRSDAEDAGNGANWLGLQYPTGDDGTLSMVFGGYGFRSDVAAITTGCTDDKLEIAMRLLDYAYTEEGNLYWNFGTKGVSWDYDADGEPEYTDLLVNDPDGLNDAIAKYSGTVWSASGIQATKLLYLKNSQEAIDANDLWFYPNEDVTAKWTVPPGITFTTEETDRLSDIEDSISTYVSEMAAKFITGEESLDNFDSFLDQLESMNLEEVLEIRQGAYDRYLAR